MMNPYGKDNLHKKRGQTRIVSVFALIVLLTAGVIIYYIFDPLESGWMPQCLFHRLTGLDCIGCGSQRMLHALLHGDISGAFRANMFAMLLLPVIPFMLWLELRQERHPGLYRRLYSPVAIGALIVLMCLWLIIRNIIGI